MELDGARAGATSMSTWSRMGHKAADKARHAAGVVDLCMKNARVFRIRAER